MAVELICSSILLLLTVLSPQVGCKTTTVKAVEEPLLVGSFNIQNLGVSKMRNQTVMNIVKKILLRYDLVLIQEIVTTEETLIYNLVEDINKLNGDNATKRMMQLSERLGRGTAKEQYAYIYRSDKLRYLNGRTYPDKNDDFMRPPYIGHFATPTLKDVNSMIVIGIHTQPKFAANETSALADVYDYAARAFKVKDAIIMGDMNAGCANVRISDWDSIELWRRNEFTWLITHDFDTTVSVNCCPYDRIIIAGEGMEDAVIWNSVRAYKYQDVFGLSMEMVQAVSDHWPVEVKLKGLSSEKAQKNLKPSLCLSVHDTQPKKLPPQIVSQKTTFGFNIVNTKSWTELYSESSNSTGLLQSFQTLQSRYSELISSEVVETIAYKVNNGALQDVTSYDGVDTPFFSVLIHFDAEDQTTTVHFCAATTIN